MDNGKWKGRSCYFHVLRERNYLVDDFMETVLNDENIKSNFKKLKLNNDI